MRSVLLVLALAGTVFAQDDKTLAKQRDDKLAESWVKAGGWFSDYSKALSEARKANKPILAYFTCTTQPMPYCQKIEAGVFSDSKFPEFSKGYVLYVNITSGLKKDKNQDLLGKKGGKNQFPYMVWLDTEGNVLCGTESWEFQDAQRAIPGLDDVGKRAQWFLDVKKKATGGGNPEKIDLIFAQVQMDQIKIDEAQKKLAGLGDLTADQKTVLEGLKVRDEIKATVEQFRKKATGFEDLSAAGKKWNEIRKAGRPAPPWVPELEFYWRCILLSARKEKDAESFEAALKALKAKFGDSAGGSLYFHVGQETWKQFFDGCTQELERMKAPK